VQGLLELSKKYPIIDIRGRGLMVAVEFGEQRSVDGSYTAKAGCAAAVTKAAQKRNMILLTAGQLSLPLLVLSDVFAVCDCAWLGCAVPLIE
jgi:4-aminobutyrate aminotransferase-like enzyme